MKNLWKWVLGAIAAIAGIVTLFASQSASKQVYDDKVNDNNDEVKKVKTKTKEATTKKAATKAALSKAKTKTASTKSKVKQTGSATKTTKDFKKKYRSKS